MQRFDNAQTLQDQDRIAADRQAKKRELIDRLANLYEKNFTFNELNYARGYECGVVLNEAYEIARSKLEQGR
jgi:hypothetical protein